jgi:peptidoglycan/xylan/chitin deacetylase (PgdA/CDA1 family)
MVLVAATLAAGCTLPALLVPTNGVLSRVVTRGPATAPVVALTFDDGPNGACTSEVLDVLAEAKVPATFFVLGKNALRAANRPLLPRMLHEGHEIALHGWAHSASLLFDADWATGDVTRARDAVATVLADAGEAARPIRFYRPPYGLITDAVATAATRTDLWIVEWSVSVGDWRSDRTSEAISEAVVAHARPGDVIVLHDGDETAHRSDHRCVDRRVLPRAVRLTIDGLAARGLRIAPLAMVLGLPGPPD